MSKFNWQQPYVNIFKHFTIASDRNAIKHGDITSQTDSQIKSSIYKISGSNTTSNYIQLPKLSGQSLNLTGRYIYFLIKAVPGKSFSFHIDITTSEKTLLRISFSNMYKEFKSTSTWLQFPYKIQPPKGSIYEKIDQVTKDSSGLAPPVTKWTIFCVDLINLVQSYSNRSYSCVRGLKICSNLLIKNVITSDIMYEPGINCSEARLRNLNSFPRDLSFPCDKYENWHQFYEFAVFNADSVSSITRHLEPAAVQAKPKSVVSSQPAKNVVTSLPIVGVKTDEPGFISPEDAERQNEEDVHVYPLKSGHELVSCSESSLSSVDLGHEENALSNPTQLFPDPILKLNKIIGFSSHSGSSQFPANNLLKWTNDSQFLVYACQSIVVALNLNDKTQHCFVGHADKVSCLSISPDNSIIASGQTGPYSLIRLWDFQTKKCLSIFRHHDHSLSLVEFSACGNFLCGVGKDKQGKSMLVLWDIRQARKNAVKLIAKAHTDVNINRLMFVHYDSSRLVTCGKDNFRFWRLKNDTLRSCAINLSPYLTNDLEFTDLSMNSRPGSNENLIYSCTTSGQIFVFNVAKMEIEKVKIIESLVKKSGILNKQKNSPSLKLNSISISDDFCVTGSDDGFVRLWPLDFSQVCLEAEHDSSIVVVKFSAGCQKIASATSSGNLGVLDIELKSYSTLVRSHTNVVNDVSLDPTGKYLATCSDDGTLRVWCTEDSQQLYDFSSSGERPISLSFMPANVRIKSSIFACGFSSGKIRIFNLTEAKLVNEIQSPHQKQIGTIWDLEYSNDGKRLISGDSLKFLCLYDSERDYVLLRVLPNSIFLPKSLVISEDQKFLSVIGPSNYLISVFDSMNLNETMRINILKNDYEPSSNCFENTMNGNEYLTRLSYSTNDINQLVCVTSENRLLKFDLITGKLLSSMPKIHRTQTDCITVTNDGNYLITSGDNALKVWDYHFRFDKNYQTFIGHSSEINRIVISSNNKHIITVGDSIVFWDFLAYFGAHENKIDSKRTIAKRPEPRVEITTPKKTRQIVESRSNIELLDDFGLEISFEEPKQPPIPENIQIETILSNEIEDTLLKDELNELNILDETIFDKPLIKNFKNLPNFVTQNSQNLISNSSSSIKMMIDGKIVELETENYDNLISETKPVNSKHLVSRKKDSSIAKKRFSAPDNKCGLRLDSIIGYNGKFSTENLIWNSDHEFFASSIGSTLCVEDLKTGQQKILTCHHEDITCVAMKTDMTQIASVSPYLLNISLSNEENSMPKCQIVVWDCANLNKVTNLFHKNASNITSLKFSTDDRFLISIGDYKCSSLLIWYTHDYSELIYLQNFSYIINDIAWNPYKCNELIMTACNKTLLKCSVEEKGFKKACLSVTEFDIPHAITDQYDKFDFTAITFGGEGWLLAATSNGLVTVWNLKNNSCFLNWKADSNEIGYLVNCKQKLITGSSKGHLKLWNIGSFDEIKKEKKESFIIENEIHLNGAIKCCNFDSSLEIGIIGTSKNTLWYVNWNDESSVRIVSTHGSKINQLICIEDKFLSSVSDDGCLNLWSIKDRERLIQFEVKVAALCQTQVKLDGKSFKNKNIPDKGTMVIVGYADGSIRLYSIEKKNIISKIKVFSKSITSIAFCERTNSILVGSSEGLIAVIDLDEGMTNRILEEHKGSSVTCLDSFFFEEKKMSYWCAASQNGISIWSSTGSEDIIQMVDWLSFPAFETELDSAKLSPTLAYFELKTSKKTQVDTLIYIGHGLKKNVFFYNFIKKELVRKMELSEWAESLALSPKRNLLAFGTKTRLLQIKDYNHGTFQDYSQHSDTVSSVCFSCDGKKIFSSSFNEIFIWNVNV